MKKTNIISAAAITASILALNVATAFAATATVSLSASSSSVAKGSAFSVSVVESIQSGFNATGATVNLSYNPSQLQCDGISFGAFPNQIATSCSGGVASMTRYMNPGEAGLTGPQVVGVINFTALTDSGSGSVAITSSKVTFKAPDSANTATSTNGSAATYSLTSATTTPSTTSTGNTTSTYGPKNSTTSPTPVTNNTLASNDTADKSGVLSEKSAADTKKEDEAKKAANPVAESKKSNTGRNLGILVILAAVAGGIAASQRYRANQIAEATAAAAATAKKKAKKAPAKKKATTRKK